jgi:hypothetical protein
MSGHPNRIGTHGFLPPSEETHRGWAGMRAAMESGAGEAGLDDGVVEKMA